MTDEQIETIESICARLALLVDRPLSVELMREIFELRDVRVRLAVEDGDYIAYVRRLLVRSEEEEDRAIVRSTSSHTCFSRPKGHKLRRRRAGHPPAG